MTTEREAVNRFFAIAGGMVIGVIVMAAFLAAFAIFAVGFTFLTEDTPVAFSQAFNDIIWGVGIYFMIREIYRISKEEWEKKQ